MYDRYVEVLARHATDIFAEMTGTPVVDWKVRTEERFPEQEPFAYAIDYEHQETSVKGQFVLSFANKAMAVGVASALAKKMGLEPVTDLDEVGVDILNEFLNTIVGRTISDWDRMGMPVHFSPPTTFRVSPVRIGNSGGHTVYGVVLNLAYSQLILRVNFSEQPAAQRKKRIMLVEDSTAVRRLIAKTLEEHGYDVLQAENGRRATELYPVQRPDLLILDIVMPEMGGLEAMQAIRQQDAGARFIVLTSTSRREQVLTAKKLGVLAYIIKPFNPELLMKAIKKALPEG